MNNINIKVDSRYMEEESKPNVGQYIFSYTITIENQGDVPAKLLRRHWIITDETGKTQKIEGEGVIGEQPYLKPGEQYQYTSGTLLSTGMGTMKGKYKMVTDDGNEFDAYIPEFLLSIPRTIH